MARERIFKNGRIRKDHVSKAIQARLDEKNMRRVSRALLLVTVERALQILDSERAGEIMAELESRLPTDGRKLKGDGLMWRSEDGRAIHIHDLSSTHLLNIINMLSTGRRTTGEAVVLSEAKLDMLGVLKREAQWRGLNLEECSRCQHPKHGHGLGQCSARSCRCEGDYDVDDDR